MSPFCLALAVGPVSLSLAIWPRTTQRRLGAVGAFGELGKDTNKGGMLYVFDFLG
jgi:hypothetical protein